MTERTYTLADMARAWDEGHSWGWSNAQDYIYGEYEPLDLGSRHTYAQRTPNPYKQEKNA